MTIQSKAFVFDFDDTLATTDARVVIIENGQFSHSISAAEYNTYILADNQSFHFGEFKNPEFIVNGKPLGLIELAKAVHAEGHSLYILTARNE
jgi:FMN phosphatase YigB (HAD superfamily)